MDTVINFVSKFMIKVNTFFTEFGGLTILALFMASIVAELDYVTVANILSPNFIMAMMANDSTLTQEAARLKGHVHIQNTAYWMVLIFAVCAFWFRLMPSRQEKPAIRWIATFVGILLGMLGTIGMADSIIYINKLYSFFSIFSHGSASTQFVFASIIAWMPTIIIEGLAIHLSTEYKEMLKEISKKHYESLVGQVDKELSNEPKKKAPTILNFPSMNKTGTI